MAYFIQRAIGKKGALHRQLGLPASQRIPVTLLRAIKRARIGTIIKNPTQAGPKYIRVTPLLKKRAVLALTLRGFHRK